MLLYDIAMRGFNRSRMPPRGPMYPKRMFGWGNTVWLELPRAITALTTSSLAHFSSSKVFASLNLEQK